MELRQLLLHELDTRGRFPTWWARLHLIGVTTSEARAEFKRLEAEGVVARHRESSRNNIIWVRAAQDKGGSNGL